MTDQTSKTRTSQTSMRPRVTAWVVSRMSETGFPVPVAVMTTRKAAEALARRQCAEPGACGTDESPFPGEQPLWFVTDDATGRTGAMVAAVAYCDAR